MKKVLKTSAWVLVLAIFIGTIVYLYDKSRSKPEVFETSKPFKTDIIKKTVATGSVKPRYEIEIKPTISGIVSDIYVEAGQKVKKGELLAKVQVIPNMVSLNEAEARVKKAEIQLENAETDYERYKGLYEEQVIPASQFQQYDVALKSAREELKAAESNLRLIKEGVRKEADNSSNTLIRSTIDGMVLDVPVEIGNSVIESNNFNAGTTIAMVANMNNMIFEGHVDETEVGKIEEGMPIELTVGAIEETKFNAILEYISPKGTEENGAIQFEIRAALDLDDTNFVRAGYSANADIVLQKAEDVMAVKESLVQFDEETPFVEIEKEDGHFEKKELVTGLSDGVNIQVVSGLSGSESLKVIK
ncbi:MAG: efflux RND transporter periplasmic adaptor subunit [Bacteroidota bacterium]